MHMTNTMLTTFEVFRFTPETKSNCEACGAALPAPGSYRVPGVGGAFCSVLCIETALFGGAHCRWCGQHTHRPYSSVKDRLCSPACEEQFFDHVHGDYIAELGRGVRLWLWLRANRPELHRQAVGVRTSGEYCGNPKCTRGENGQPASLAHLRIGAKYCSLWCKKQAARQTPSQTVLTGTFDPSETRIKRGFSRPCFGKLDSWA